MISCDTVPFWIVWLNTSHILRSSITVPMHEAFFSQKNIKLKNSLKLLIDNYNVIFF